MIGSRDFLLVSSFNIFYDTAKSDRFTKTVKSDCRKPLVCVPVVWFCGGFGCGKALLAEMGLPQMRGYLLDKNQQEQTWQYVLLGAKSALSA